MKTAWLKNHAVFYVARLSRASRLSSSSRLFYKCAVGVVCFAVADDEKLAVDEALVDIRVACCDILYSACSWVVVEFNRNIV